MKKFTKKRLLYIVNGLGFAKNVPVGGSDKRAAEIGQRLGKYGFEISVLTTPQGSEILKKEGLKANFYLTPSPWWWKAGFGRSIFWRFISYLYLTLKSPSSLSPNFHPDVVYATSDFFFDIIPALKISKKNSAKFVAMSHHLIKNFFKRQGSYLTNLILYLGQQYSFRKMTNANLIFLYATPEGEQIGYELEKRRFDGKKIAFVKNGVDLLKIKKAKAQNEKFEAVTVAGLRQSKGIFDFALLWSKIKYKLPRSRWLIIGGGEKSTIEDLKKTISAFKLEDSIILAGPKSKQELYPLLKSGKIFIFPSYEEGWGIAISEAMAAGLPVVAYNLPAYKIFKEKEALLTAPLGNNNQLAKLALCLLKNSSLAEKIKKNAARLITFLDWGKIAQEEAEILWNKILA